MSTLVAISRRRALIEGEASERLPLDPSRLSLWVTQPDTWLAAAPVLRWIPTHLHHRWMGRLLVPTMLRDVAQQFYPSADN